MKVKDLYEKYKDYDIVLYGKPLKECYIKGKRMTPFVYVKWTGEELENCIVVEMEKEERKHNEITLSKNLKHGKSRTYKGDIYAYITKDEK